MQFIDLLLVRWIFGRQIGHKNYEDFEHPTFWDTEEETLVIATHGIVKKTQKTPLKEIAKAEEIRKEYFNSKKK